jgi:hypothetical protein
MPDAHDPAALICHAAQAGDWWLVALIVRILSSRSPMPATTAHRAYVTLVSRLGLVGDAGDYHRD